MRVSHEVDRGTRRRRARARARAVSADIRTHAHACSMTESWKYGVWTIVVPAAGAEP